MRVIAFDRFKSGVTMETIEPHLKEEDRNFIVDLLNDRSIAGLIG
jgi:hypothetical protein